MAIGDLSHHKLVSGTTLGRTELDKQFAALITEVVVPEAVCCDECCDLAHIVAPHRQVDSSLLLLLLGHHRCRHGHRFGDLDCRLLLVGFPVGHLGLADLGAHALLDQLEHFQLVLTSVTVEEAEVGYLLVLDEDPRVRDVGPALVFDHDGGRAGLAADLDGQHHVLRYLLEGSDQVLAGDLRDEIRELDLLRRDVVAHGGELQGDRGLSLCLLTLHVRGVGRRTRALGLHDLGLLDFLRHLVVAALLRSAGFFAHG